jgi:hypothetical protein
MNSTRGLAGLIWGACVALAAGTLGLLALGAGHHTPVDGSNFAGWSALSFVAASLAFATVGAMVAARVPENAIGWIFCLTGVALGASNFASQYANQMLFISSHPLPGGTTAAWLQNLGLAPSLGLLGLALLLFPDGRLPSRRWRPIRWLALVGIGLSLIGTGLHPGPLVEPFTNVSNPVGIAGSSGLMDAASGLGFVFMLASVALAGLGIRTRLRRSHGVEREQLKWLALAAATTGLAVVADLVIYLAFDLGISISLGVGFTTFPVAAGVAILRYRLYDIDVVINRALVYGALTATLAGGYLGTVLLLQLVLSPSSDLAVAGSTLAVAALFRPLRHRIQGMVDRRFFRHKYDATRTLESFGARLRDEVELDRLSGELLALAEDTMQPAHATLWLRSGKATR